jgi:NADH:ubiquinone oxidoreductase subunit K
MFRPSTEEGNMFAIISIIICAIVAIVGLGAIVTGNFNEDQEEN